MVAGAAVRGAMAGPRDGPARDWRWSMAGAAARLARSAGRALKQTIFRDLLSTNFSFNFRFSIEAGRCQESTWIMMRTAARTGYRMCLACMGDGRTIGKPTKKAQHKRKSGQQPTVARTSRPCTSCEGVGLVVGDPVSDSSTSPLCNGEDVQVAIVGSGIGGAAAGLALQQRGIRVALYERDNSFDERAQGYGLTMQQGAQALRLLGLPNEGTFSHTHHSFLPDGSSLGSYGRAIVYKDQPEMGNGKGAAQRRNAHIPRQALRSNLLSALRGDVIHWGRQLERFEEDGSGVTLHFHGMPRPARAQVLLGADGIWSSVRRQMIPAEPCPLRYLGVVVVLGRAKCTHPLAREQIFQTLDGDTRIYVMPFSEGVSMWQLSFRLSDVEAHAMPRDGASLRAEALRRCGGWHQPIPQLLEQTLPQDITGYPAYDRDALMALRARAAPEVISPEAVAQSQGSGHGGSAGGRSMSGDPHVEMSTKIPRTAHERARTVAEGAHQTNHAREPTAQPGGEIESEAAGPCAHVPFGSRVTLLGDASHPMSPFKGQGANQALLDGIAVAKALRKSDLCGGQVPLHEALAGFEEESLRRGARKAIASREAVELLHSEHALVRANITRASASREARSDSPTGSRASSAASSAKASPR